MIDYRVYLEKLRTDATESALIRDLATDNAERDFFDRLSVHLSRLADEVEQAIHAVAPSRANG